ncbi:hypothetical protein [Siphonobacter sp. SORGH_AS_1065]|uniref:hypothetical protein n=1 Tax=Siphonobacter sp. SORGH_AS_1065 TaxID=3041795 RepID=UPI00277DA96F|nr:hypothetical protein [Siphonobacter sp. SORGH_AS_1065]MDQ1086080.1 hypothetical protein [Siphonobacter sp. SORGH_AS_1065]
MRVYIVEDKAHKELIITLLNIPNRSVIIGGSRGETCKLLAKKENAIGIVDEDPRGPGLPEYLKKLSAEELNGNIRKYRDFKRNNVILMLKPDAEGWGFDLSRRVKIDLQKLVGTTSFREFHDIINRRLDKWRLLIQNLESSNIPALQTLKLELLKP